MSENANHLTAIVNDIRRGNKYNFSAKPKKCPPSRRKRREEKTEYPKGSIFDMDIIRTNGAVLWEEK